MTTDFMAGVAGRIRIVLVGTQHPGNIGSAARAMKTMGLTRLVLVAPERAPDVDSHALAAGADDVLDGALLAGDLRVALAGCHLALGCTARSRRVALPEVTPREAAARVVDGAATGEVALVFGRERTGLSNDELHLCQLAVHIPANPDYSSLNLAAAVQVLAYETRMALLGSGGDPSRDEPRDPPASHEVLEGFYAQLADTLDAIDFHKGRTPASALRKLRRIFNRAGMDEREVRLLRGVLADAQRMARLAGGQG
jgi:tRNA (cytidine32/uridine32-2'-O)-methyltransferase